MDRQVWTNTHVSKLLNHCWLCEGVFSLPAAMDFTPVPPGTAPAAAVLLRGPDPDVTVATGDEFDVVLGAAVGSRNAPVAGQRLTPYSAAAGAPPVQCVTVSRRRNGQEEV